MMKSKTKEAWKDLVSDIKQLNKSYKLKNMIIDSLDITIVKKF